MLGVQYRFHTLPTHHPMPFEAHSLHDFTQPSVCIEVDHVHLRHHKALPERNPGCKTCPYLAYPVSHGHVAGPDCGIPNGVPLRIAQCDLSLAALAVLAKKGHTARTLTRARNLRLELSAGHGLEHLL